MLTKETCIKEKLKNDTLEICRKIKLENQNQKENVTKETCIKKGKKKSLMKEKNLKIK